MKINACNNKGEVIKTIDTDTAERIDKPVKYDMQHLPVRKCSVFCKEHPEWGNFGIMEDKGHYYDIYGNSGWRTLSKTEAERFWEVFYYAA